MNTKTTAIVVVIAIALGVYLLVFQRDLLKGRAADEQPPPSAEVSGSLVLGGRKITGDIVSRLRIERAGEPVVVIERRDKEWTQVEPVKFPLQSWDIDRIVSDAAGLRFTTKFTPAGKDLSLDQLGLSPPRAVLTIEPTEGKPTTFYLGKRAAAGGAYLTVDKPAAGGTVYVVGDSLHATILDKQPQEWRNRTLTAGAPISPASIRRVTLQRDGEAVELVQSDGKWVIEQPVTGRADREAASQLARLPGEVRISKFIEDNPNDLSAYGLDRPQIVLTVESSEPVPPSSGDKKEEEKPQAKTATHKLAVGGAPSLSEESYFAQWDDSPVVFTLSKADVQKLRKPVDELRDRRLTPADRASVREVLLQRDDRLVHLVKDAGEWKFGDPSPGYEPDSGRVDELLKSIFDAKARDFTAADSAKLGESAATITIALTGSEQPETLAIFRGEGDALVSVRGGERTGYIVDPAQLEPIFRPAIAYRDRTVWDISQEQVTEVHVVRTGEYAAEYRIARAEPSEGQSRTGQWKLDGIDGDVFQALLDRVAPLMAQEWLIDPPAAAPAGVTIELTLNDGAHKKVSLDPASRIAAAQGVEALFRVRDDVVQAATAELRDRVVLQAELDEIATVKLGSATIERDKNGQFKIAGDQSLTEQKAASIYDALAGLAAERFVASDSGRELGEPKHTLRITKRDDQTSILQLWLLEEADGKRWIARLDEGEFFTVNAATVLKLTGQAPEREEPVK